jgi:hypothetical protein
MRIRAVKLLELVAIHHTSVIAADEAVMAATGSADRGGRRSALRWRRTKASRSAMCQRTIQR